MSQSTDPLEREADRVADRVTRMTSATVMRACSCRDDEVARAPLARGGGGTVDSASVVPAAVGQPLPTSVGDWASNGFGVDFSSVRIHTDGAAAVAADSIDARAYTVGSDIVFGYRQFEPGTPRGQRLIAHELVHVVQRGVHRPTDRSVPADTLVSRACGPAELGSVGGCVGVGGQDVGDIATSSMDVFLFDVDCDTLPSEEERRLRERARQIGATDTVEIHGFASEEGDATFNNELSCARAWAAATVLNQEGVSSPVVLYQHGATPGARVERRSVVVDVRPAAGPPTPPASQFRCGPDVTAELERALVTLGSQFDALPMSDKADSCASLVFVLEGALNSWDIIELHNRGWIVARYRPQGCATVGATPPCSHTVEVGGECYFGGSPNYVVFGHMMRQCADKYAAAYPAVAHLYTRSTMLELIDEYKGPESILGEGGNYPTARAWAEAGYDGWPASGTPPPGDRPLCTPDCPVPFTGPTFRARWCPEIDPAGQCPITRL